MLNVLRVHGDRKAPTARLHTNLGQRPWYQARKTPQGLTARSINPPKCSHHPMLVAAAGDESRHWRSCGCGRRGLGRCPRLVWIGTLALRKFVCARFRDISLVWAGPLARQETALCQRTTKPDRYAKKVLANPSNRTRITTASHAVRGPGTKWGFPAFLVGIPTPGLKARNVTAQQRPGVEL